MGEMESLFRRLGESTLNLNAFRKAIYKYLVATGNIL